MLRNRTMTIAIVSSSLALASSALAGQTSSDRSYWPSEVAATRSQLATISTGPLSSFALDTAGLQSVHVAIGGKSNGVYQGGPHPK